MPAGLPALPYDVLFSIVEYLSLEDAVHFGLSSQSLNAILRETTLCRKVIQTSAKYSIEAGLAKKGHVSYEDALLRLYCRRKAFQEGEPYHVRTVAKAENFVYSCGILCTLTGDNISLQDLKKKHRQRYDFSLASLHRKHAELIYDGSHTVKLLAVHEHTLAILLQADGDEQVDQLVALTWDNEGACKILVVRYLDSTSELFVRMDGNYLYYGTHSGMGDRNHHEWIIRGVALHDDTSSKDCKYQLEEFVGCEIGSTVDFKINNGYFYAVSNQTSFVVEEVDWTSFYTVIRFPLGSTSREEVDINRRIYRRQHADGPIHDSWTTLSLQHNERSEDLYIVESRREWLNGGSKQTRTFYKQVVWFEATGDPHGSDEELGPLLQLPKDDLFATVVTSDDNPRYAPRQELTPDQVHPEYGNEDHQAPAFIIAKTRLRDYELSSSAFVDLVEDNKCCGMNSICLRLRIGSRRAAPLQPLLVDGSTVKAGKQTAQTPYRYSYITLWPPSQSSSARQPTSAGDAHCAMNPHQMGEDAPPAYLGLQIIACSDERSVVYMVKPARPRCDADRLGTIVFVSFDPFLTGGALLPNEEKHVPGVRLPDAAGWSREVNVWPGFVKLIASLTVSPSLPAKFVPL